MKMPHGLVAVFGALFLCSTVTEVLGIVEFTREPSSLGVQGHGVPSEEFGRSLAPPIQALVMTDSGVLYAGSFGMGVFRSEDQGKTWAEVNVGLHDLFILSLAADSQDVVYAGTVMGGVFRTTKGGQRWERISQGLKRVEVKSLLAHKHEVYAGTGRGVYRWEEVSQQWKVVAGGLDQTLVPSVIMVQGRILLAGTAGKGLLQCDIANQGKLMWREVGRDLVDPKEHLQHKFIRIVAVGLDDQVYVGTQDGGLFSSRDLGQSWVPIGRSLPNDSIRGILPNKAGLVAATGRGIYMLDPRKNKWRPLNVGLTDLSVQVLIKSKEGPFYAGTSSGAFRSDDGGEHWVNVSEGFGVFPMRPHPYF